MDGIDIYFIQNMLTNYENDDKNWYNTKNSNEFCKTTASQPSKLLKKTHQILLIVSIAHSFWRQLKQYLFC